ncbi:MAG: AbrB/MazE/SpoVT family DNA-binding domain-containing protein [Thermaerobacter sp.]|nr:AbrB/MazE/SpoVT family DNA-binding domain-containing protein [Thermaerobacter sp.]
MQHYLVQLRDRGVVTLPKEVRERYGLAADTPLTLIDWDGILVLSSRVPVVTELARQLAAERAAAGVTVDDLLTAWAQERYGTEVPPSTDDA